jgi:hypothetical protein
MFHRHSVIEAYLAKNDEREGPPANGPDGGSGGKATHGVSRPRSTGYRRTMKEQGIYGEEGCRGKRKVVCYPAGGGGGQAALLPLPAAPGRLPEGGRVGKRSQRLRGAGRLTRSPPPPHSNRSSTTFLPRWPAQGPPSHIFEPAAKAPLQLL